ncbi:ComF family protein [Burkholderia gladioli]|uniref:ComF family protein n=1 Tax=Burkholderia gladioli TaxID=28095 RepID=UPI00163F0D65|nr:ComF family protein [Burkholderia gladioli]
MRKPGILPCSTSRGRFATIRRACERLLVAALPNLCLLCGNSSRNLICEACDIAYWNESRLRCLQCALPLAADRAGQGARLGYRCERCRAAPPPFDATLALGDYRPPLDTLALDLKFGARLAVGRLFGERLAHAAADLPASAGCVDLVLPVPLARRRLIERGYNQAWAIARPFARDLAVPADARRLARSVDTAPQSRLDLAARRANVEHAFALSGEVRGLHLGLVDDVMTSGATLAALAALLKQAGARRVTNFVALRTPRD